MNYGIRERKMPLELPAEEGADSGNILGLFCR
jgi:hypothetical protein